MSQTVEVRTFTPAGSNQGALQRVATLFSYRGLIYNLVMRELKVRYKNSVLGFVWSLLNPLAMMIVFTLVFGVLWPNGDIEKYPLFLLCGLVPWQFFSNSVMSSINSIVGNGNLVKKVYFPREVLPIATVLANLVNFLLAFIVLFGVLIVFQSNFSPWLWMLPLVILIQTCFTLGIAFFLSTINVFYRDTMMVMDVVMLAWFFLTPIFYSIELVPATMEIGNMVIDLRRLLYILNPMASIINMYRDLLYWGYRTDLDFFLRTALTSLVVLAFGYWFFIRYSNRFGEEV
jgi:ABC-type polysaccharide/polyol phosphate export permease